MPNLIKYDVCAEASLIQSEAARMLPMQISQEMTLQYIVAVGPRLMMTVVWHLSSSDLDEMLTRGGMSHQALEDKIGAMTTTMVCGQKVTSAFVGLGGEVQYAYRTQDGSPVHSPVVTHCE